jgi:ABC-type multidrug transport system fused ATPase/permease subunit
VFEGLSRLLQGTTAITIAHRLATVLSADVIFVLNDGVISERGTHEELVAQNELYAHLYHMQFRTREAVARGTGLPTPVPSAWAGLGQTR